MQAPQIHVADVVGPVVFAVAFVCIMALVREPARRNVNVILVAGAGGVYLSGGFGLLELVYAFAACVVAYHGLRSHRYIGLGWLMHAGWDALHHAYGNAIWPFMPTSSFGCMIFDTAIAVWFLAGAPSIIARPRDQLTVPRNATA